VKRELATGCDHHRKEIKVLGRVAAPPRKENVNASVW